MLLNVLLTRTSNGHDARGGVTERLWPDMAGYGRIWRDMADMGDTNEIQFRYRRILQKSTSDQDWEVRAGG